jgi:hypothetical protein
MIPASFKSKISPSFDVAQGMLFLKRVRIAQRKSPLLKKGDKEDLSSLQLAISSGLLN